MRRPNKRVRRHLVEAVRHLEGAGRAFDEARQAGPPRNAYQFKDVMRQLAHTVGGVAFQWDDLSEWPEMKEDKSDE